MKSAFYSPMTTDGLKEKVSLFFLATNVVAGFRSRFVLNGSFAEQFNNVTESHPIHRFIYKP